MFFNREPAKKPEIESLAFRDYLMMLPRVLRTNLNFSRYLLSQFFIIFGGTGVGFYVVYTRYSFQTADAFVANLTITALIAQSTGIPVFGWLSDLWGHKWLAKLSAAVGCTRKSRTEYSWSFLSMRKGL